MRNKPLSGLIKKSPIKLPTYVNGETPRGPSKRAGGSSSRGGGNLFGGRGSSGGGSNYAYGIIPKLPIDFLGGK